MSLDEYNKDGNSLALTVLTEDFWLIDAFKGLQSAFLQNKLPHGLLINAAKGYGQLKLAYAVAASLLCQQNSTEASGLNGISGLEKTVTIENQVSLNMACGQCKSCLLLKAKTHPDFSLEERLIDKGKLKQNISIDQMRALSQKLLKTSQLQGWRIAIINSIEDMNISSFNAILKTLEEPGQNTLIMLISHGMAKVPATIKSRCQILNLNANKNKTLEWLLHQNSNNIAPLNSKDALNAMDICHGAPYASLEFINQGQQTEYLKLFRNLDAILSNQVSANELLLQHKEQIAFLIPWVASYFHQVSQSILIKHEQRYKNVPHKTVFNLYEQLINLNRAQASGSNLQLTLQLEAILIHWFELGRKIVHYSK
jgi:DNA polymerase-3 subunit delta'